MLEINGSAFVASFLRDSSGMAATSSERWIDGLQFSSVLWPPPRDPQQHKVSRLYMLETGLGFDICDY